MATPSTSTTYTATTTPANNNDTASTSGSNRYEMLRSLNDVQSVRDLNSESVRDILRRAEGDQELEVTEMGEITDMSGLNDAFNSSICSLKVKARLSKSKTKGKSPEASGQEITYNFVIKSPPKMSFIRQVHKLSRPFFNEVSWYLDLSKQLDISENTKEALKPILPRCFHAYSSHYAEEESCRDRSCCTKMCPWFCCLLCRKSEQGVLILENVKLRECRSFTMFDKHKPLPLGHVRLIMRQLAAFHGKWLRFIRKAKLANRNNSSNRTEGSNDVAEGLTMMSFEAFEKTYNTQKRIPKLLYKQLKNVAKQTIVKVLSKEDEEGERENIERCKHFFDNEAIPRLSAYMKAKPGPVYTLCHGDFWSNNILFAYDERGSVCDLVFIDFQLIFYGHPAYDLVYFIYLNTDLEFRDNHLEDVLRLYYDTFVQYVKEDEAVEYTFEDFKKDFDFHRPLGFSTACSVMPNVMSDTQVDLEAGLMALRSLQRKQANELVDDSNPNGIEVRRRLVQMVHEMVRDKII